MIVYGWRQAQTAKEDISECTCHNCGKPFTLSIYVFHRYAHIFWIPLFPIGKTVKSHCSSCGLPLEKKEMPQELRHAFGNMNNRNRIPVWMFSGLILIAGGIICSMVNRLIADHKNKELIENPFAGDVYEVKQGPGIYTTYKVERVADDTVFLLVNQYTSDMQSGFSELKAMEYNDTAQAVFKPQLLEMFNNQEILTVERE
ncbi:MAG: zinc-ribbon protein [Bacteroidetes bacterium]|nr:zinc-ribbon protein [Bacteroidota bacterium]